MTPPPSSHRVGPLNTIHRVRAEMARLYKEARSEQIKSEDASRLTFILMSLARLIEQSDLEARLTQLERSLKLQQHPPHRNGVNHAN